MTDSPRRNKALEEEDFVQKTNKFIDNYYLVYERNKIQKNYLSKAQKGFFSPFRQK